MSLSNNPGAVKSRRWYRKNPELARALNRASARRYREERRERCRRFRDEQRREDPNYAQKSTAEFRAKNPNYVREYYHRRKLRDAWLTWTRTLAANRRDA